MSIVSTHYGAVTFDSAAWQYFYKSTSFAILEDLEWPNAHIEREDDNVIVKFDGAELSGAMLQLEGDILKAGMIGKATCSLYGHTTDGEVWSTVMIIDENGRWWGEAKCLNKPLKAYPFDVPFTEDELAEFDPDALYSPSSWVKKRGTKAITVAPQTCSYCSCGGYREAGRDIEAVCELSK